MAQLTSKDNLSFETNFKKKGLLVGNPVYNHLDTLGVMMLG